MWIIFKAINLFWLLASTYIWITALIPQPLLLVGTNIIMLISLSMLPFKIELSMKNGFVLFATIALSIWMTVTDGWLLGVLTFLMYLPAQYLMILPYEYQCDLLKYVTKWYAILLSVSLVIYWMIFFIPLPSFGQFVHPIYPPYTNYLFFIKTTAEYSYIVRFNGFFLEPGHQALVSTFLLIANKFEFKRLPWLFVLVAGVIFSFSLAGYILAILGFAFIKVNTLMKGLALTAVVAAVVGGAMVIGGGDNDLNTLIIKRLEYDETDGIKGNNRFYNNTDYEFQKLSGTKYFWTGVNGRVNMKLIGGAGYKIYILHYGMVGTILAFLFYLSVIPTNPNYRYTIGFFAIILLCFLQRSYPFWYSWIFPYVLGIYIAKGEKETDHTLIYNER